MDRRAGWLTGWLAAESVRHDMISHRYWEMYLSKKSSKIGNEYQQIAQKRWIETKTLMMVWHNEIVKQANVWCVFVRLSVIRPNKTYQYVIASIKSKACSIQPQRNASYSCFVLFYFLQSHQIMWTVVAIWNII